MNIAVAYLLLNNKARFSEPGASPSTSSILSSNAQPSQSYLVHPQSTLLPIDRLHKNS